MLGHDAATAALAVIEGETPLRDAIDATNETANNIKTNNGKQTQQHNRASVL